MNKEQEIHLPPEFGQMSPGDEAWLAERRRVQREAEQAIRHDERRRMIAKGYRLVDPAKLAELDLSKFKVSNRGASSRVFEGYISQKAAYMAGEESQHCRDLNELQKQMKKQGIKPMIPKGMKGSKVLRCQQTVPKSEQGTSKEVIDVSRRQ